MSDKLEKKMSVLDELRKLDEQRAKLLEKATTEAKTKLDAALAEYNALGYNLVLAEDGAPAKKKAGITRQRDPNAVCSVCQFATLPKNHDGRLHRAQGKNKKPFTTKELEELGLKKA